MTPTSHRWMLVGELGLASLAGCVGELDVGQLPLPEEGSTSGDGSEGSGGMSGPGMTSSMLTGTPPGDSGSDDASSDDASGDDTTTGAPPELSPPCELGGPGPGHDPAVQWGVVCGGSQQELIHALGVDGTGAVYVTTQLEGFPSTTVLMGDDEIPSGEPPTLLVTKLAPDGEVLWNRSFFAEDQQTWWYGGSLAVCNDRVYLLANRSGTPQLIDFGTGLVDGNMAVVAFDTDGQTQWAMATGQDDEFSGGYPVGTVTCRGDGVVIRGSTAVDVTLGGVTLEGSLDTVDQSFVVVLDADGNASWGTIETTLSSAAALGPSGELVTAGTGLAGLALTRYAADGALEWQHGFPATGGALVNDVAIDDAGGITLVGGYMGELDLGLGPLVNADPPDDPLDPTDDWMIMDGFVSHHDGDGLTLWTTTLAETGYDAVNLARLASDGMPAVLWRSTTASQLLATDGLVTVPVATLPGSFVQAVGGHPVGGFALAWTSPTDLEPFVPPLMARGGLDFTVVRIAF